MSAGRARPERLPARRGRRTGARRTDCPVPVKGTTVRTKANVARRAAEDTPFRPLVTQVRTVLTDVRIANNRRRPGHTCCDPDAVCAPTVRWQ